jgi:hypothetical protein
MTNEEYRAQLPFTLEEVIEYLKTWPLAYGWWKVMNQTPWGPPYIRIEQK